MQTPDNTGKPAQGHVPDGSRAPIGDFTDRVANSIWAANVTNHPDLIELRPFLSTVGRFFVGPLTDTSVAGGDAPDTIYVATDIQRHFDTALRYELITAGLIGAGPVIMIADRTFDPSSAIDHSEVWLSGRVHKYPISGADLLGIARGGTLELDPILWSEPSYIPATAKTAPTVSPNWSATALLYKTWWAEALRDDNLDTVALARVDVAQMPNKQEQQAEIVARRSFLSNLSGQAIQALAAEWTYLRALYRAHPNVSVPFEEDYFKSESFALQRDVLDALPISPTTAEAIKRFLPTNVSGGVLSGRFIGLPKSLPIIKTSELNDPRATFESVSVRLRRALQKRAAEVLGLATGFSRAARYMREWSTWLPKFTSPLKLSAEPGTMMIPDRWAVSNTSGTAFDRPIKAKDWCNTIVMSTDVFSEIVTFGRDPALRRVDQFWVRPPDTHMTPCVARSADDPQTWKSTDLYDGTPTTRVVVHNDTLRAYSGMSKSELGLVDSAGTEYPDGTYLYASATYLLEKDGIKVTFKVRATAGVATVADRFVPLAPVLAGFVSDRYTKATGVWDFDLEQSRAKVSRPKNVSDFFLWPLGTIYTARGAIRQQPLPHVAE